MKKLLVGTVIGILIMAAHICWAGIPFLMNYQGMLTDDVGNPINEPLDLTFTIYDSPTNGTALWTETHTAVPIEGGLFNVILGGATTPIPASVFDAPVRYLGIKIETDPELAPRMQLASVGYAYRAKVADSASVAVSAPTGGGWTDDGEAVRLQTQSDHVGIGTVSPTKRLHVFGAEDPLIMLDGPPESQSVLGFATNGLQKWSLAVPSGGPNLSLWHYQSPTQWYMTFDGSNGNILIAPSIGKVGIGTTGPGQKLTVDGGDAMIKGGDGWDASGDEAVLYLGDPNHGVSSVYDQGMRIWTFDAVDHDIRFQGHTGLDYMTIKMNSGKVGIGTTNPSAKLHVITTDVDASSGLYAESHVLAGYGVYGKSTNGGDGVYGYSGSGHGVHGEGWYGVWGHCSEISGYGVYGSTSSGTGVYGHSTSGTGVYYSGGLAGTGSKSCIVKTSKGPTLLYCQESPENWFEDFGEGQLNAGRCYIELDPLFLETVTINDRNPMKVFIQLNDDCNGTYVERGRTGFDVIELQAGQSNARFTYRVVAKRSGFEDKRLNVCEAAKTDPYLYPEMKEMMDRE